MAEIGALAFLNPWVLTGLVALPILWWLLRAIPPRPKTEAFAAIRLLLGLEDREKQAAQTPWWLLALRILMIAAVLTGFAEPVLNLYQRLADGSASEGGAQSGPVLVAMDQGWASAPDWTARKDVARTVIGEAAETGRQVLFWALASGDQPVPVDAVTARATLEATDPAPWPPDRATLLNAVAALAPGETIWLHDGLSHGFAQDFSSDGETETALMERLLNHGPLTMIGPKTPAMALTPPQPDNGRMRAEVLRTDGGEETRLVAAFARTDDREGRGGERRIGTARAQFEPGETTATAVFDMPAELIARVSRLSLAGAASGGTNGGTSAGGTALADGALSRLPAGLAAADAEETIATLTSPSHYLREALAPWAILREGDISEMLEQAVPILILTDHGAFAEEDAARLIEFVEGGGVLIRFAGPRLAAAIGGRARTRSLGEESGDPLLPVRLRRGGRVLGGALSWSRPRTLGPFAPNGPFRDLQIPDEIAVRTQVLAEPSPDLHGKVWAALDDGTPLVTAVQRGGGWIVLFHVAADAEWSSLPLSGLFVEMLGRIFALAPGSLAANPAPEALVGTEWRADAVLDAWGRPVGADTDKRVLGEHLAEGRAIKGVAPGIYLQVNTNRTGRDGVGGRMAVNLFRPGDALTAMPDPPHGVRVETLSGASAQPLGPWLLVAALALAIADGLATMWLGGRLWAGRKVAAGILAVVLPVWLPASAEAQDSAPTADPTAAVAAAADTTLGYIKTGDPKVDRISKQGLRGLGIALAARTSVESGPPVGVDPEQDEMHVFPVLYWPLIHRNPLSDSALGRLAEYLTGGGLLLIDTQDGELGFGRAGSSATDMRRIARTLNLPPLAPVGGDHVLTRSFYLLDRFPGRWRGGTVWAEAPDPEFEPDQGAGGDSARDPSIRQFDRVDDNVSPVVVGAADWAAAWAVDANGRFVFPVGRVGDRQRETALRFGVNLVLYALTGNYKSDLVHAPAVLERLGQ